MFLYSVFHFCFYAQNYFELHLQNDISQTSLESCFISKQFVLRSENDTSAIFFFFLVVF